MSIYFIALVTISVIFMRHSLSFIWIALGIVEVVGFFYFTNTLTKQWGGLKEKTFTHKLFYTALAVRVCWVIFSYFLYLIMTGEPFEFSAGDVKFYDDMARYGASLIKKFNFNLIDNLIIYAGGKLALSDSGYSIYLSFIYALTGNSIFITRIIKAFIGAWTVVLIYRTASRNFGESTGRMAGIMAMIYPNLILYTGLHLKEVEMVFLVVAFVERADYMLRSKKITIMNVIIVLLISFSLFTFRTVLGAAVLFALLTALILSSAKTFKAGNRFFMAVWVVVAITFLVGGKVASEVEEVWEARATNQEKSYEWREKQNSLVKYATQSVLAPIIFTIPFSSMVFVEGQENQALIHGGNFIKNILAFFIYFSIIWVIRKNKWRDFVLIEALYVGYILIIALSAFAHSERFHQPTLPFFIMFVAYGISNTTNKTKKYFNLYAIGIFVILIAWAWFKLAGRGLE